MSLRLQFLLFVTLIHVVLIALAWQLRTTNLYLFFGSEVLLIASITLAVRLYRGFVRPFELIAAGTAAIQAKDFSMKFVPVGQREMDQLIDVYNQMIDELRHERVSQHEKSFLLERLIQASPAGVLILDFEGRIESANPAAERFLAQPAAGLLGRRPAELPGAWGPALAELAENQPQSLQLSGLQTYRVHAAHFFDRGFLRRFILLEELTQELMQQEKQAYGKLIRMMSHEINNSIGAINSILQSFTHYAPQLDPDDRPDFTQALEVSIARNTQLANFIGGFARLVRLPAPAPRPTDLHALLRSICRLLQPQSEERHIRWHLDFPDAPLFLSLDAQQLEQALLNIAKNALEAIGNHGNIWVHTTSRPTSIVIQNDGPGLTPEISQRLFTPFFSTKRDGQGIGLTLVRDILLAHGFRFRLETVVSGRTQFVIEME
ncbi:sensor histidine kinase [Hymenobacter properus]|uniref:histidine kinase n=1 Tax=Hymenobacter properus TaxID=2791026 RepID=A0A931BG16_9BACT|nr:ATP-binding protein [Hymenobacter properus]MBF9142819.1 HAMP domain-containing protein [Hymenobacter properus]MBR7721627.1 HAMP domain-containing protein [Microvirga sp. SRT04]